LGKKRDPLVATMEYDGCECRGQEFSGRPGTLPQFARQAGPALRDRGRCRTPGQVTTSASIREPTVRALPCRKPPSDCLIVTRAAGLFAFHCARRRPGGGVISWYKAREVGSVRDVGASPPCRPPPAGRRGPVSRDNGGHRDGGAFETRFDLSKSVGFRTEFLIRERRAAVEARSPTPPGNVFQV